MHDFDGEAFLALADLCGFKVLAQQPRNAYNALSKLYNTTYRLAQIHEGLQVIAVSDCVIAWVPTNVHGMDRLLSFLKALHLELLNADYLLRTTIAGGVFKHEQRLELPNLDKQMVMGSAYLDAYLSNSKATKGSIRILNNRDYCTQLQVFAPEHFRFIKPISQKPDSDWEYFWSITNESQIEDLKSRRRQCHRARFDCLKQLYRTYMNESHCHNLL